MNRIKQIEKEIELEREREDRGERTPFRMALLIETLNRLRHKV